MSATEGRFFVVVEQSGSDPPVHFGPIALNDSYTPVNPPDLLTN